MTLEIECEITFPGIAVAAFRSHPTELRFNRTVTLARLLPLQVPGSVAPRLTLYSGRIAM